MADDNTPERTLGLSAEHAEFLSKQAVDIELAERLGVRSLLQRADNPEEGVWPNWANHPAILFPWTNEAGDVEHQVRPDNPTNDQRTGRPRKYVFQKDMTPILWAVRPVADATKMLIVEGTKQVLAAASYAPAEFAVYGIAGCRSWQVDGQPIADLEAADGRQVVVILDADAAHNPQVYDAGTQLATALIAEGATKVRFGQIIGADKAGLDDVLGGKQAHRRAGQLERIIDGAKAKPAETKPKTTKKKAEPKGPPPPNPDRATIICNRDRRDVINDLTGALLEKWNATQLFNHGGVLSWKGEDEAMRPVDRGSFYNLVQDTAVTMNENEGANGTTYSFTWPDSGTMSATMSLAGKFAPLERISHAPFVRPDGTIVTEPGYDDATRTLLVPDPIFAGLTVPEDPDEDEIAAARNLILKDWLGDFPFDSDVDRANLLALLVTPAVRGMLPKVPLAVVDGLQMGVGKNLLADSILTVYTGEAAQPMNWVSEPDELRKQITAAFRTGQEFFVFDEAHTLEGAPLAQALTASTWQDRILGVSTMAEFPNRVTWISLGNQVQVKGDINRRVYRIALRPTYANPQDRDASSFQHPGQSGLDLGSWTRKNRRELMTAILTLVRAWFAKGQPRPARGVSFGSFEVWERITGGIVETAGLTGFLDNLKNWRSESDFETQYWAGHLGWLREQFGNTPFRTAEVKAKAMADPQSYLAPPRLDDPAEKSYGKSLGESYSRLRGRRYGKVWIERAGFAHGHVTVWMVGDESDLPPAPGPIVPTPEPEPDFGPNLIDCPHCNVAAMSQAALDQHLRTQHGEPETVQCPMCTATSQDLPVHMDEYHADLVQPAPVQCPWHGPTGERHGACEMCREGDPEPAPENEHAEARGPAPEDTDGEGHEEVRGPADNEVSTDDPQPVDELVDGLSLEAGVATFDLETGDADDLYREDGSTYIKIGATAHGDQPVVAYDDPALVPHMIAADLHEATTITGHNIMAFDLPALVRAKVLTMPEIHQMTRDGRLFDGLLAGRFLDPPMAKDKGVDQQRRYDLGTLGTKYGIGDKYTDLSKPLAKKYGGWGAIPIDLGDADPERAADAGDFQRYMVQDVELSRRLHAKLLAGLGGTVPPYLVREHRVAALAAQIQYNGFLVDQPLLNERVTEVNERKAQALGWLVENAGMPTADAKGNVYKSPLSTKIGKAALEEALVEAGVSRSSLWKTENAGELQVSADHMIRLGQDYRDKPKVVEIAKAVYRIVGARSVYQTALDNLCPDGRVHPKIGFEQATGRWSVTKPGLTVFGKRGGRHVERDVFLPDPGEVLISCDLSQVDMRAVAGLSQDLAYINMLKREDPHAELAIALFGDVKYREQAKAIGHGWNYGESLRRISESNDIPAQVVKLFDTSMRERFPRLVEWREEVRAQAESGQLLDNGFGRMMRADPQRAHTQAPALKGQGAARDIMMEGLLRLPDEILPMLRAQIHDEIVLSVPKRRVTEIGQAVVDALSFDWNGVPIMADVSKAGTSWGMCYSKN